MAKLTAPNGSTRVIRFAGDALAKPGVWHIARSDREDEQVGVCGRCLMRPIGRTTLDNIGDKRLCHECWPWSHTEWVQLSLNQAERTKS